MSRPPDDADDGSGLARTLILRASLAVLLVVGLLGGMAIFEALDRPLPPLPVARSDPPAERLAPLPAAPVGQPAESAPPTVTVDARAPEPAPAAQTQADGPPPTTGSAQPVVDGDSSTPPAPALAPAASTPPEPQTPASPTSPEPARGFLIQLGVFGAQENAQALQAALGAQGIPARLESRVVVGPFADRAAAKAAMARLRKAGHGAGLLVPPRPSTRHAG